jgi:hypothetical protein
MKKINLILEAILFCFSSATFAQSNADLTGAWVFTVETDQGSGTPTFNLKQDAEGKLTGTYEGQLGATDVKGTVKANAFHIEFMVQDNLIVYDGTLENETVRGKVVLGTLALGTFTGKRKP